MEAINKIDLGNKITEQREAAGETQSDLLEVLGYKKHQQVSYIENGNESRNLSLSQLKSLAKHFNVSSDYLLGLTEAPTPLKTEEQRALRAAQDYTGLSEAALNKISNYKNMNAYAGNKLPFLSAQFPMLQKLIEDNNFDTLLEYINRYCYRLKKCSDKIDDEERVARVNSLFSATSPPTRDELKDLELFKAQKLFTEIVEKIGEEYEEKES